MHIFLFGFLFIFVGMVYPVINRFFIHSLDYSLGNVIFLAVGFTLIWKSVK